LIASFDEVVTTIPEARLEIVGENRTKRPRLDLESLRLRSRHPERITIRSYVDDRTLAELYHRASVFVFLSEYEGFGFTPLEALIAGVPPVLLDTAVARETCGAAARYVSSTATNGELAAVISDLLAHPNARQQVMQNAGEVLNRYHWERTAAATLSVLAEAAVGR
jgi:glycosyltransferase involved in cell wall biosynthesis